MYIYIYFIYIHVFTYIVYIFSVVPGGWEKQVTFVLVYWCIYIQICFPSWMDSYQSSCHGRSHLASFDPDIYLYTYMYYVQCAAHCLNFVGTDCRRHVVFWILPRLVSIRSQSVWYMVCCLILLYSSFSMADNFVIDIGRQYEYTNVCTCR